MEQNKEKNEEYKSFDEYMKVFFPDSVKKKTAQINDSRSFGINLAKESLLKIQHQLV